MNSSSSPWGREKWDGSEANFSRWQSDDVFLSEKALAVSAWRTQEYVPFNAGMGVPYCLGGFLSDFVGGCPVAAADFVQGVVEIEANPGLRREDDPDPLDVIVPAAEIERANLLLDLKSILLGVGEATV